MLSVLSSRYFLLFLCAVKCDTLYAGKETSTTPMNTTENTPLWLDLKKEYLDDNWDRVQDYFKKSAHDQEKDSFYHVSLNLFREKIRDLVDAVSHKSLFEDDEQKDSTVYQLRQLATYLLVNNPEDGELPLNAYMAFMAVLRQLYPSYSHQILKVAIGRLCHERVVNLGFSWNDLGSIGQELFAYNAVSLVRFDRPLDRNAIIENHGTALLTRDGILLTHESRKEAQKLLESGVRSLDTGIGMALLTSPAERLKQSHQSDLYKIDEFIKDFLASQEQAGTTAARQAVLKSYSDNDYATVRISNIDRAGTISVETVDTGYEPLQGIIIYSLPSIFFYDTKTLYKYFKEGDILKAKVVHGGFNATFSIEDPLRLFFDEDTKRSEEEENEFNAKLLRRKGNQFQWINEFGIAMYSKADDNYNVGDYALLAVSRHNAGDFLGKIDADILGRSDDVFDEKEVRKECMRAFAEMTPVPETTNADSDVSSIDPLLLKLLVRMFFAHQKTLVKPTERFQFLAYAAVMAKMTDDMAAVSYIIFEKSYLKALVLFARNESIRNVRLAPDDEDLKAKSTLVRLSVVDLLKEYGRKDHSEKLSKSIEDFKDKMPMLSRLALLIQTSNSLQGILTDATLNVIRREIIKTLSIETENQADLEVEGKAYLGTESDTQEFKTSMVFPSDNHMQADEKAQNLNIMKGICAFLNSMSGGTLFIGVNDQGYVCGIANDLKHLRCQSIDSYLRYIQDRAYQYFGKDVLPYLHIEQRRDQENVYVAIRIDSHPYRVVEVEGRAFLRINAESREMTEMMRRELIAGKVFEKKDEAAAISLLQHASANKRCVVLHNYASSNSGSVKDRTVEAYDVRPEDGLVIGFDRAKQDVRVFNINRIGYVEVLQSEPWKYQSQYKDIGVDAFHMTGTVPIHISWEMNLLAKNLLVEEYPAAEASVSPCKGNADVWYFDGDVYDLKGIGRFYIGLAPHIKIHNAPELKAYVRQYLKDLEKLC